MATKEGDPNLGERSGETIRNVGIVGGIIGVIGLAAKSEFAASFLFPSAIVIVTGVGLKMISKSRRVKNK